MWDLLIGLGSIILINLVVSGDNALVIGLASRRLPREQRQKAIFWGTFGAIAIRIVLTLVAVDLLKIPFLKVAGALFLLYVAVKLISDDNGEEAPNVKEGRTLRQAILTIIVADLILSIDNIFAVAAAGQGHIWLILFGLALSIPMIIFGSNIIMRLMVRFPLLVYLGAGAIGWTSGSMLLEDKMIEPLLNSDVIGWVVPILTTLLVFVLGKFIRDKKVGQAAKNTSA